MTHADDDTDLCPICLDDRAAYKRAQRHLMDSIGKADVAARRMRIATMWLLFAGGINIGAAAVTVARALSS